MKLPWKKMLDLIYYSGNYTRVKVLMSSNYPKVYRTASKARLKYIRSNDMGQFHWLFLPGGPGLGSESLSGLVNVLKLPGTMWYADLPGDGSNITEDNTEDFSRWSDGLIELVTEFDNVILVAHSSGGFFALATPELENELDGLVLMDSAPDASWQEEFYKYVNNNPIAEAQQLQQLYHDEPSNIALKNLTIACAPYFSRSETLVRIRNLLNELPFNYETHLWAENNFDKTYQARWVPKYIPTMIFSGFDDHITPIELFVNHAEFQRDNIQIYTVNNASHFPWIDNPAQVKKLFSSYCSILRSEG